AQRQQEVAALRAGIDHGLTVIDTAEMYADGGAEEVVGQAIRGLRDRVVLVSKVYPWHAGKAAMHRACENSLRRLQTDYLDMYLLHWRGD
ncbi:aldo/keto reductase, partial [Acinetobacter baumannii]